MFFRLYTKLRKKDKVNVPMISTDITQPEVIIPVGGISSDGTVYETEVRPEGNTPIYKEVRIDGDKEGIDDTKKGKED